MGAYKRGNVWWYKFCFQGIKVRESSGSTNKTFAERVEREHRRRLEMGAKGMTGFAKPMLFATAVKEFLEAMSAHWSPSSSEIADTKMKHLLPHFGKTLLSDVDGGAIGQYQAARKKAGASPRSINMEVSFVRQILRKHRLWGAIEPDIRMLREESEIGRALTRDEEKRLLAEADKSRSRSFRVALRVLLNTGMRVSELRTMTWGQIDLMDKTVRVGRAKTLGSEGRIIPLNIQAFSTLTTWLSNFPNARPEHYVFPSERYGLRGGDGRLQGTSAPYQLRPNVAMGSWKVAWNTCRTNADVSCRLHDLRHTFISRLAENPVSDSTIMAIAGHRSVKMKERYSHTRMESKRRAVEALDMPEKTGWAQNWAQDAGGKEEIKL